MGTISEEISRIIAAKSNIIASIATKGQVVPAGTKIDAVYPYINAINQVYPVEGTGEICVTFIDYKGNILKKHYGNAGFNATAPTAPVIEGMIFGGWNIGFTNVQYDTVVGTLYYTASGKLEIDTINNVYTGGLGQVLMLFKDDNSLMTVEWGNGNISTTSQVGAVMLTNTLAVAGNYTVKVGIATGGTYRLWSGTNGTGIMGQTVPPNIYNLAPQKVSYTYLPVDKDPFVAHSVNLFEKQIYDGSMRMYRDCYQKSS